MKQFVIAIVTPFVLWFLMFSPITVCKVNFWVMMTLSALSLIVLSLCFGRSLIVGNLRFSWKDIGIGIGSAAVLWGVFWLGNYFSNLLFDFADGQVQSVYAMKNGGNQWLIAMALLLVIGPAEEIFWHGFVQKRLSEKIKTPWVIAVTSLIYSAVHLPSFNFMLIMAALVCGLFWSTIYYYNRNLLTVIISHALWDVAVFVLFPIS